MVRRRHQLRGPGFLHGPPPQDGRVPRRGVRRHARGDADAPGVQALRTGLLPHRPRGLGSGPHRLPEAWREGRSPGRPRAPRQGGKHRVRRGAPARRGASRGFPLQQQKVRRRRSHSGERQPVRAVPDLRRARRRRRALRHAHRLHDRPDSQHRTQNRSHAPLRNEPATGLRQGSPGRPHSPQRGATRRRRTHRPPHPPRRVRHRRTPALRQGPRIPGWRVRPRSRLRRERLRRKSGRRARRRRRSRMELERSAISFQPSATLWRAIAQCIFRSRMGNTCVIDASERRSEHKKLIAPTKGRPHMETQIPGATENLWDSRKAEDLSALEALAYRSNLLGRDRAVANYGGGNTSAKGRERDHTGREVDVLWVKGSGSDLATIEAGQFTGLKLDEVLALEERDEMSDEEMVAYLASCQLAPDMPRGSIETLLHAFVPYAQVDHTHPDAVNMICCSEGGEELARECFGGEAVWIPYIRPGFTLSKQVGAAVKDNPEARFVLLAKHGLVTWGDTHEESYGRTIEAINWAAEFVASRAGEPFGGRKVEPPAPDRREALLAQVLPTLRGALSSGSEESSHKILRVDHTSEDVLAFVCGRDSKELSQVGAACPDHLVRTKVRPLWVDFDPANEGADELEVKLREGVEA